MKDLKSGSVELLQAFPDTLEGSDDNVYQNDVLAENKAFLNGMETTVQYFAIPGLTERTTFSRDISDIDKANLIINSISKYFDVEVYKMKGKSRITKLVKARHFAIFFLKERTSLTLTEIGEIFGKDHTTVIHARQAIHEQLNNKMIDSQYKIDYNNLSKKF